jgi:oligosaccharide reducing-end xylanase
MLERHAFALVIAACLAACGLSLTPGPARGQEAVPDPAEPLLDRAKRALANGDRRECWRAVDLVVSNYPYAEPRCRTILDTLEQVPDEQKVGRVHIATWPRDKDAAVSLCFDDALRSAYDRAAPALNGFRWRGTFYLIARDASERTPWIRLARAGHEIGNHTWSHPHLSAESAEGVDQEVRRCSDYLEREIVRGRVLTFAYPFCDSGKPGKAAAALQQRVGAWFLAVRGGPYEPCIRATPTNLELLPTVMIQTDTPPAAIEKSIADTLTYRGWLLLTHHELVDGPGWSPIPKPTWEAELAALHAVEDRAWIAPVATVASYVAARRDAVVESCRPGADRLEVSVRCKPRPRAVLQPLWAAIRVPADWQEVCVERQGDPRLVRASLATFEVMPDGSRVTIRKTR